MLYVFANSKDSDRALSPCCLAGALSLCLWIMWDLCMVGNQTAQADLNLC